MSDYCDTCGHQYSDICGTCETLEGVPIHYSPKTTNVHPIESAMPVIHGKLDMATGTLIYDTVRTNADRIRAMSDEELVKEFIETMADEMFFNCPVCKTKTESECFASNCEKCWVEWLKQEVPE